MVASSVGEEGLRGVNGVEGGAGRDGKVTAGQTNTRSVRWDQTAISARMSARRRSLRPAGWKVGRTGRQLALSRAGEVKLSRLVFNCPMLPKQPYNQNFTVALLLLFVVE